MVVGQIDICGPRRYKGLTGAYADESGLSKYPCPRAIFESCIRNRWLSRDGNEASEALLHCDKRHGMKSSQRPLSAIPPVS